MDGLLCHRTAKAHSSGRSGSDKRYRACLLAIVLGYLVLVNHFWFTTDDAYITFRYARNLAEGWGPRFNVGAHAPIEGYSNFLWMLLCAGFERVGLDPARWANRISTLIGLAFLWQVHDHLRNRLRLSSAFTLTGLALCALHPPLAVYSSSGLETLAFATLLFGLYRSLSRDPEEIVPWITALWGIGVTLIRVEGIFWVGGLFLLSLAGTRWPSRRQLAKAAGLVVAVYGAYWVWRYDYYGHPFSNTVQAKIEFSWERIVRGYDYVMVQVLTQVNLGILLGAGGFSLFGVHRKTALFHAAVVACCFGYAILVGGDFMAFGRFLLPAWPFVVSLGSLGMAEACRRGTPSSRVGVSLLAGAAVICGLLPAVDRFVVPYDLRQWFHFRHQAHVFVDEHDQWIRTRDLTQEKVELGKALRLGAPPTDRLVLGSIGAVSYHSRLFVFDRNGLVTAIRHPGGGRLGSPGHDRTVPHSYFLTEGPDVVFPRLGPGLPDRGAEGWEMAERGLVTTAARIVGRLRKEGLQEEFALRACPVVIDEGAPRVLLWAQATSTADEHGSVNAVTRARLRDYVESSDPAGYLAGWLDSIE